MSSSDKQKISVGARSSPLSQAQIQEVLEALHPYHPSIHFEIHLVETIGDRDQITSLRTLERTDFFTREIDQGILQGRFQIGIHSAKDLPHPLSKGLSLFCLTQGVDSSDALVLPPGKTLESLPKGSFIATSSLRREQAVRQLRHDLSFCDIRGTIEQRLMKLQTGEVAGIVVAEAALIRLKLTHLNRITLPGTTAEGQGQLAIVGKAEDLTLKELFSCLDRRRAIH